MGVYRVLFFRVFVMNINEMVLSTVIVPLFNNILLVVIGFLVNAFDFVSHTKPNRFSMIAVTQSIKCH